MRNRAWASKLIRKMLLGYKSKIVHIKGILFFIALWKKIVYACHFFYLLLNVPCWIWCLYTSVSGGIKLDYEILESIEHRSCMFRTYMQTDNRCEVNWFDFTLFTVKYLLFINQFNALWLILGYIQYWNLHCPCLHNLGSLIWNLNGTNTINLLQTCNFDVTEIHWHVGK